MHLISPLLPALLVCTLSSAAGPAQTIHISGVVIDSAGAGIEGAAVKLEKTNLVTTSAADGSFTLAGVASSVQSHGPTQPFDPAGAVFLDGRLWLRLDRRCVVRIAAYTLQGRRVYALRETAGPGTHSFTLPSQASGVLVYRMVVGATEYVLKGLPSLQVTATLSLEEQGAAHGGLQRQAKVTEAIEGVIAVTKDGYLNYRVMVTNSDTTGIEIRMIPSAGTVTDADGNVYQAVRIGGQVWTVENLRTTKYTNGEPIAFEQHNTAWVSLGAPAYCYFGNKADPGTVARYGALYNFYAVERNAFVTGWHVPTDAEWDTLQNYLIANGYNWDGTTSENRIAKSLAAKTDWRESPTAGGPGNEMWKNNRSGFSALPGGQRHGLDGGWYTDTGGRNGAGWWSTTELDGTYAWGRSMNGVWAEFYRGSVPKSTGYSVRLVKD